MNSRCSNVQCDAVSPLRQCTPFSTENRPSGTQHDGQKPSDKEIEAPVSEMAGRFLGIRKILKYHHAVLLAHAHALTLKSQE